ncbi:AAA family ATPase [Actinomadura rugatobispora]|uniref:AAA family ATPase n=1 Tax=Actinomadura rugatobispora TaxID=1994 RepID=A0ABW1AHE4_9ACTN|nr:LuxR family transcriptional regulator [Actinomadura rugatobispora]
MRTSWPFTGRASTLDEVGSLLNARATRGVVVAGDAGVGKTRLVNEALERLEPDRFTVVRTGGTSANTGIPFGAFGHLLPVEDVATTVVNPLRWATEALRGLAEPAPLLVAVDDAHLLDPTSAALVHHLVLHREARVLATVRTGAAAPDPVTALWKDDLARRLDLVPLTKLESQAVVEAALGGQLGTPTARRLYHSTRGNLLFLHELVLSGLAEGRLAQTRGVWHWDGDLPLSPRLRGLIETRLAAAGEAEREVLEYVALGEPIGAATLAELTSEDAVERAETRSLVASSATGRRLEVRTAHPLYGEVARAAAGPGRVRDRLTALARTLEGTGMRRHGDLLRVALWHLDAGAPAGPDLLLAACGQAFMLHDMDLALRCGRSALAAGVDAAATVRIAPVLLLAGRHDEVEAQLSRVAAEPMDEATRTGVTCMRSFNLSMGLGEQERAEALLDDAAAHATAPALRQQIQAYQAVGRVYSARFAEAEPQLAELRAATGVPPEAAGLAGGAEALRLVFTGRFDEAVAMADEALDASAEWLEHMPSLVATYSDARAAASLWAGDLAAADSYIAYGERLFTEEHLSPVAATTSRTLRVEWCLLRGDIRRAVRWAHEAVSHGTGALWALSGHGHEMLAYAASVAGDAATATTAVRKAQRRRIPGGRIFHFRADLGRAWIRAASGDVAGAAAIALDAATRFEERTLRPYAMFALHDAVRLGAAAQARDRLADLAEHTDGPLVRLCARHADAAARQDPEALDDLSKAFADRGMTLYAAETAAEAARAHERHAPGSREANAAATRAWLLAGNCTGARTPALSGLAAPELTTRQLEIARLAAAGLGNREIAERLVLSVRTVANHLQAVYDRVGVTDVSLWGKE